MAEQDDREESEAKAKRIKRWHRTGSVFETTPDLYWLFVKLAIANGGEIDVFDQDRLREFVAEPIWAEIFWGRDNLDELLQQGAALVENSKFQCTTLRDFLVKRIIACLIPEAKEQKRSRSWQVVATVAVIGSFALVGLWGLLVLGFVGWLEFERFRFNERLRQASEEAKRIYSEVCLGGYDEHVIIRRLEALEKRHITIPSVLYALLRLPRHNMEAEISNAFNALGPEKKNAICQQWKAFLDFMLKNDDGEAKRKARDALESHRAKIFEPIRKALNELSDHFKDDSRIVFTSKSGDLFPSTYSIEIKENGKQQYYIYVRCEKHSVESEVYSYPMRVVRNPDKFSEWLFFYPGDEQNIVSIIGTLLLDYQQRGELTVEDVRNIVQRHKQGATPQEPF